MLEVQDRQDSRQNEEGQKRAEHKVQKIVPGIDRHGADGHNCQKQQQTASSQTL